MRTNVTLAVFLFVLAACLAPHARERQQPEPAPSVLGATQASASTAADPHALPELRRLMRRPLPWEPLERTMAKARRELFYARDSGAFMGRMLHTERGEILALEGDRVAVRFASIAAARSVERSGAVFNATGYKGEAEFFLREGCIWIGTCKARRADTAAVVGDQVATWCRNQNRR